ncbi:unnamed protein product [Macrosiphum euphorbiae]|uniref:DDE Tnp4 domain-containing protein n=1 Tax=Macrosiphum euphorbiae TaxID=13131 RepID=A0AAV0XVU8_9HEMI|nr:unnamed protein product [Macrosiphum euphorbiae]
MYKQHNKKKQLAIACAAISIITTKQRKKRSQWVKNWKLDKSKFGNIPLLSEIRENNPDDFRNYLRMDSASFDVLLNLVGPKICKMDTVMRSSISSSERLIATLRFLATGNSYEDMKFSTCISTSSLSYIIPETCKALYDILAPQYLKFPSTAQEWIDVANGFKNRWQFINAGGAIDGKHIRIVQPANSGAQYYNYKGFHSIVLMAIVNSNHEFIYIDVGKNGRLSDGGIIECTEFYRRLQNNQLHIPDNNETNENLNFVFLADDAFPLQEHILKPFPQRNLSKEKRIFNYRFSRARNCVENTFGLITTRFRVLHHAINLNPEKAKHIVLAICVLHNFLRQRSASYLPPNTTLDKDNHKNIIDRQVRDAIFDLPQLQHQRITSISTAAKENRDKYKEYFNSTGAVEWQEQMISAGRA